MFVAYPLIWSVLFRERIRGLLARPASVWFVATATCVLLWFEETWVIVDHGSPPWQHYVHYFGFYAGVTATILWLYRRYRYTVLQTFVVGGLWGTLVEQQFAGPKMLFSGAVIQALGLRALRLSGLWPLPCGTTVVVFRGVQPIAPDGPLARTLAIPGHCGAAIGDVAALVGDPLGMRV